nr:hypothetical protein Q903MT_gene2526 [Picea sitchensis]
MPWAYASQRVIYGAMPSLSLCIIYELDPLVPISRRIRSVSVQSPYLPFITLPGRQGSCQ